MLVKERMRRDPMTVREDDDLATALSVMLWTGTRHLPVLREGKLVGLLSERDILRRHDPSAKESSVSGTVREAMTVGAVITHPTESLADATARMLTERVGCLPVLEAGKVVGILTTTDLLAELASCAVPPPAQAGPRASELMTPRPFTAHADDRLADAAARMVQHGIRHLPVVDGDGSVIGMVSDRDVRTAIGNPLDFVGGASDADFEKLVVADVMTPEPRVVPDDAPLARILSLLVDERLGAVPVVDAREKLVGIVSYLDVLRLRAPGPTGALASVS